MKAGTQKLYVVIGVLSIADFFYKLFVGNYACDLHAVCGLAAGAALVVLGVQARPRLHE